MHMLWVYVEHGAGCAQISAKASAQRKQEESDAAQVREYSVSCGLSLSLSFSSDVNGAPGWLVCQQRWSEISTRLQPFPSFNEGKTRLDESCQTQILRPGSFVFLCKLSHLRRPFTC